MNFTFLCPNHDYYFYKKYSTSTKKKKISTLSSCLSSKDHFTMLKSISHSAMTPLSYHPSVYAVLDFHQCK